MSTLAGNCRGLGNPYTVQVLLDLVQTKKPTMVFLMETMIDNSRIEAIRAKMNYEGLFTVAGPCHGGGLALFWKHTNMVEIKSYSQNHIDTEINLENIAKWRLTCFHGCPERTRRRESWNLLRNLANQSPLPWAVMGDFNDMLRANEKRGKHLHPSWPRYGRTSIKSRGTVNWVEERLDRVCVNDAWRGLFPPNKVVNQICVWRPNQGGFRFHFENTWLRDEGCSQIVEDCWKNNNSLDIFQNGWLINSRIK
ncbi:Endonuclease/exonuclease/phosphatase family protein [Heracleum sosnowskyi]|uniref:Endonuclease/exonuclease/phosphatase family protein n=1 Tax=Heracleum sosnowskyi TaxID=360622 RepID=A0AAD8MBF2_9APIA|nr:Endonuclease/exonuclease/phosphatase family protein [Heracleum sosnowskyi]